MADDLMRADLTEKCALPNPEPQMSVREGLSAAWTVSEMAFANPEYMKHMYLMVRN